MLGLDTRIGSIEEGKDADLLIHIGPPLDYRTYVLHLFLPRLAGRVSDAELERAFAGPFNYSHAAHRQKLVQRKKEQEKNREGQQAAEPVLHAAHHVMAQSK